jgi:hypothetical protein
MKLKLLTLMIFGFILPFQALAVSPSAISITLAPQNPKPSENTTITLDSFVSNLDSVLISWFVGGTKAASGTGQKSFSTKAPAIGEVTVRAVVSLPDGAIEKKVVIRSASMVLLWQATDSYVPPFYRGKAMPTIGSDIKIVAMPEVRNTNGLVSPKNMTYAWKRNYTNDAEASGYGKNSFTYTNDYLENSENIEVVASTLDGGSASEDNITVNTSAPQILFYKNDSILGTIWEQALYDGYKIQGDATIVAEPYFISPKEILSPSLVWNWSINDSLVDILGYRKNLMPLRAESGTSGASRLKLEIENTSQLLETASKEINIEF